MKPFPSNIRTLIVLNKYRLFFICHQVHFPPSVVAMLNELMYMSSVQKCSFGSLPPKVTSLIASILVKMCLPMPGETSAYAYTFFPLICLFKNQDSTNFHVSFCCPQAVYHCISLKMARLPYRFLSLHAHRIAFSNKECFLCVAFIIIIFIRVEHLSTFFFN